MLEVGLGLRLGPVRRHRAPRRKTKPRRRRGREAVGQENQLRPEEWRRVGSAEPQLRQQRREFSGVAASCGGVAGGAACPVVFLLLLPPRYRPDHHPHAPPAEPSSI